MQYRQGDVLIVKVDSMPKESKIVETKNPRGIVLAYGEVTGHAHAIKDKTTELYEFNADRFLKVLNQTKVRHEEHGPIVLDPGIYKVIIQKEYTPQEIRNVAD